MHVDESKEILATDMQDLPVPVWATVVLIIGTVGLMVWVVAAPILWLNPLCAPFSIILVAFSGFSFFYKKQSDARRKAYKSWFDIAWNLWTIIGTAALFYAQLDSQSRDLAKMLASTSPGVLAAVFAFAFSSAAGRLTISACDAIWLTKPAQK